MCSVRALRKRFWSLGIASVPPRPFISKEYSVTPVARPHWQPCTDPPLAPDLHPLRLALCPDKERDRSVPESAPNCASQAKLFFRNDENFPTAQSISVEMPYRPLRGSHPLEEY